jgi:NAD(P)-dependent dehydrogenase (short-subunit alcohol dehydrogenase family)
LRDLGDVVRRDDAFDNGVSGRRGASAGKMTEAAWRRTIGAPDEFASAVLWLCCEAASYVSATVLAVDGGDLT